MKRASLFLLILIVIFSSSFIRKEKSLEQNEKGFKIIGFVKGFKNRTRIFLEYNSITDSTFIINGRFKFSGAIDEKTKKVLIRTTNNQDYNYFWLENSIITFKAEKGKFRYSEISGSETQIEQNQFNKI